MKPNRTILNFTIFIFLMLLIYACNSVSLKNVRNDFKWKKKKFKTDFKIQMIYKPIVLNEVKSEQPEFYSLSDTINIDSIYRIEELLYKKLKKRNVVSDKKSIVKISIDTLLFREYTEGVSVYEESENNEYIGESERDFFRFEIIGYLSDTLNNSQRIFAENWHETYPRQSFTINGVIVKDGITAKADRMIENAINEFTYRVYEKLIEKE